MAQPTWITPAGNLGVIPEGVFFQLALEATDPGGEIAQTFVITSVPNPSGAGAIYRVDGVNRPQLTLVRGKVYTFVQSAASNANHQIAFRDSANNPYTTGVVTTGIPGQPGAQTVFTVPSNAPDNLRYYCVTHGNNMGNVITVQNGSGVAFALIAGSLPQGIQLNSTGNVTGVPVAAARIQGVPLDVSRDITSKFTVRASSSDIPPRVRDRTFEITITGDDTPEFITPAGSLGSYYDGDELDIQIAYTDTDAADTVVVRLAGGELPEGVTVSRTGLISGYIQPAPNVNELPGYDVTPVGTLPYDFLVSAINKNYQFTLEVTDGRNSDLRTFEFFVYDRNTITADTTSITADNTFVTADETTERRPFIINAEPSNLGLVRGDNYYAYQFIGNDFDTPRLKYAISVNQGTSLPPDLELDPVTGWYYGEIPDQGITEIDYSFNIVVYQDQFVGTPVNCTATTFGTNGITCTSTEQLGVGQPIVFTGNGFGGIVADPTKVYYVLAFVPGQGTTQFTVTERLGSGVPVTLTTAVGSMTVNLIVASNPYPFEITIAGDIDAEVTWLTDSDLGVIDNGDISLLAVQAVNRGGRDLEYRLESGAFNELPQGLELLPTGEISGRVSFNTFAVDLGATTFDRNTTWDSTFRFTVNAYAQDTQQLLYDVESVTVVNGGTGFSAISTPVIEFSSPVGASAFPAQAGNITVDSGAITSVALINNGRGYTGATGQPGAAVANVVAGFGGSGAVLLPIMRVTGVRDVVSVFKTFTVRVRREYDKPYQNLEVQAMPPANDRALIAELLNNNEIFVPDFIFRASDPFFGKADSVVYQHAFGLDPDTQDRYVESLYLNHYWKELVLGSIETAQARDASGNIVYEVVYSRVIDDLTNNQDQSVGKIVNLAYPITGPGASQILQVYPNSLTNMRDQVIDVVGQLSTKLPLWMTSKQDNGRVLGFTPAWVMCYTQPGRSRQIAYYISTLFGKQLNLVDFKVDRYVLDTELSRNWDTTTQRWTPTPSLTTFDRFNTGGNNFIGEVSIATDLAYSDVNLRTLSYINSLGGLDGIISAINGDTLIFVKQQNYNGPPGSDYPVTADAWQDYLHPFDQGLFDQGPPAPLPAPQTPPTQEFDEAVTVSAGDGSSLNDRMAIYTISVDPVTEIVRLTLTTATEPDDFVQVVRGNFYRSAQLRYPTAPGEGLTDISWLPLETVVTAETFFDEGSVAFTEPVDMYDPTDQYDKYLVFPKANILA